jgi:hypothetical protein
LKNQLSRVVDAKIKEWVSVGSQIRELMQHVKFKDWLSEVKEKHGKISNFSLPILGEVLRQNTVVIMVADFVQSCKAMRREIFISMHFFDSHLVVFLKHFGALSDEHGERFHQDISTMERRHQGTWISSMVV